MSKQKAIYIKEIAKAFKSKTVQSDKLKEMTIDQIRSSLIKIKGIGPWTIDMFLMFTLHRFDVFPILDLGFKIGFAKLYQSENLCDDEFMLNEAEKWKPFRTLAAMYLWKIIDENIEINGE